MSSPSAASSLRLPVVSEAHSSIHSHPSSLPPEADQRVQQYVTLVFQDLTGCFSLVHRESIVSQFVSEIHSGPRGVVVYNAVKCNELLYWKSLKANAEEEYEKKFRRHTLDYYSGFASVLDFTGLKNISFTGCRIDNFILSILVNALQKTNNVVELGLAHNMINDKDKVNNGVQLLTEFALNSGVVKKIDLTGNLCSYYNVMRLLNIDQLRKETLQSSVNVLAERENLDHNSQLPATCSAVRATSRSAEVLNAIPVQDLYQPAEQAPEVALRKMSSRKSLRDLSSAMQDEPEQVLEAQQSQSGNGGSMLQEVAEEDDAAMIPSYDPTVPNIYDLRSQPQDIVRPQIKPRVSYSYESTKPWKNTPVDTHHTQ